MTEEKDFLEKLASCIESRDLDACVDKAVELAKEMGISPEKMLELSGSSGKARQFELAYVLALSAAQGLEKKAPAYYNAAHELHDMQMYERAENLYRKAIQLDPNYAPAHFNFGNLLVDLGRKSKAEEQYKLAIQADPNFALAHHNFGVLLRDLGRMSEADLIKY
jgi:tetratricopeptide (TPR) repeat protein